MLKATSKTNKFFSQIEDAKIFFEELRDKKQETFDNKSEKWQESEAGSVANECGLSPRQLLEQRDELLEALKKCAEWIMANCEGDYELTPWRDAVNALGNITNKE